MKLDDEACAVKIEERRSVAHSILLFFAMEKEEQDQYLPPIERKVHYISDGDTGDKTMYPAYYFCARSMDCLAVYPPRCGRIIGSMIDEMHELITFMILISPDPKYDPSFPGSIGITPLTCVYKMLFCVCRRQSRTPHYE